MIRAWRYRALAVAAVALAGLVSAGCGESDSQAAEPLSKQEYLAQGNQIWHLGQRAKDQAVKTGLESIPPDEFPNLSKQRVIEVGEGALPAYQKMTAELAELEPPANDKATVEKVIGEYEAALKRVESSPDLLAGANPFTKATEAARAYGLTRC